MMPDEFKNEVSDFRSTFLELEEVVVLEKIKVLADKVPYSELADHLMVLRHDWGNIIQDEIRDVYEPEYIKKGKRNIQNRLLKLLRFFEEDPQRFLEKVVNNNSGQQSETKRWEVDLKTTASKFFEPFGEGITPVVNPELMDFIVTVECPDGAIATGIVIGHYDANNPVVLICWSSVGKDYAQEWKMITSETRNRKAFAVAVKQEGEDADAVESTLFVLTFDIFSEQPIVFLPHFGAHFDARNGIRDGKVIYHDVDSTISVETVNFAVKKEVVVKFMFDKLESNRMDKPQLTIYANGLIFSKDGTFAGFTEDSGKPVWKDEWLIQTARNTALLAFERANVIESILQRLDVQSFDEVIDIIFSQEVVEIKTPELRDAIFVLDPNDYFIPMVETEPVEFINLNIHLARKEFNRREKDFFKAIHLFFKGPDPNEWKGKKTMASLITYFAACQHLDGHEGIKSISRLFEQNHIGIWLADPLLIDFINNTLDTFWDVFNPQFLEDEFKGMVDRIFRKLKELYAELESIVRVLLGYASAQDECDNTRSFFTRRIKGFTEFSEFREGIGLMFGERLESGRGSLSTFLHNHYHAEYPYHLLARSTSLARFWLVDHYPNNVSTPSAKDWVI
jgi:hypothetical protein